MRAYNAKSSGHGGQGWRAMAVVRIAFLAMVLLTASPTLASPQVFTTPMAGLSETPPNSSIATGTCSVTVDTATLQVSLSGTFNNLAAPAAAASLRGPALPGAVAPVILASASVTAGLTGNFSGAGTLTSVQAAAIVGGDSYCEISDPVYPSGEIRGQVARPFGASAFGLGGIVWLTVLLAGAGLGSLMKGPRPARRGAVAGWFGRGGP